MRKILVAGRNQSLKRLQKNKYIHVQRYVKELEGRIQVEINVDRDGNIVAHSVTQSSGHDVLDREIPKLMKRVSPLPAPPADAADSQLTMVVPLAWALQ